MANSNGLERSMEWALGNFDEAMFKFSTFLLEMQRKPPYLSDQAELALLSPGIPANLAEIFPAPPVPVVRQSPVTLPPLTLLSSKIARQYQVYKLEFNSAVSTGYPANDRVRAYYLEHNTHPEAPAIIYLHGWMEFEPSLSLRLPLSWAGSLNLNILALHLPFHFERAPRDTVSGELSITGNLPLAVKGMKQAVSDVRQALYWLKQRLPRGYRQVALAGKSLGGLVGAMALATENEFEAGVLAVPATGSRASIWRSGYTRLIRRDLQQQGLDEEATARLLEVIQPGHYRPAIDSRRILILKARADRVCFPTDTDLFAQQWECPVLELPTGHLTATFYPTARRAAQEHLRRYLSLM